MPEYILDALRKHDRFVNLEISDKEVELLLIRLFELFGAVHYNKDKKNSRNGIYSEEDVNCNDSFRLWDYLAWQ